MVDEVISFFDYVAVKRWLESLLNVKCYFWQSS